MKKTIEDELRQTIRDLPIILLGLFAGVVGFLVWVFLYLDR